MFGTQPYGLPLGEATTPQYLKSLGYRTHGVGKVQLLHMDRLSQLRYIEETKNFASKSLDK